MLNTLSRLNMVVADRDLLKMLPQIYIDLKKDYRASIFSEYQIFLDIMYSLD